jgi:hypothetical protein
MFLQARAQAYSQLIDVIGELTPDLTDAQARQLATYAMAGADGLFIAKEIGGDSIDLVALFEMHARVLYDTALRLISENANQ